MDKKEQVTIDKELAQRIMGILLQLNAQVVYPILKDLENQTGIEIKPPQ
jgi:DNA-binding PadR family transcriptional regulator